MKEKIFNTISDLVTNFLYYDRKEDEELSVDQLNEAFNSGQITIEEIVDCFSKELNKRLNTKY